MSEANVFSEKNGYSVHFKLTAEDVPAKDEPVLNALLRATETLLDWMAQHGYEHDASKDRKPAKAWGKGKPKSEAKSDVACGVCGGATWFNPQGEKKNPRGPDYKCKGKECGAAAWFATDRDTGERILDRDGRPTLSWRE